MLHLLLCCIVLFSTGQGAEMVTYRTSPERPTRDIRNFTGKTLTSFT